MKENKSNDALAARKNKAGKLNVLIFEPEGGAPYTVDVSPEQGTFKLPGHDLTYKISRGSVWIESGTPRTCVNADNPQTINLHTLTGSDVMHPSVLNGIVENNLAEQVAHIAKTKPIWARGTTWGIMGVGVVMGLLMFWLIKVLGTGLEDLQTTLENMKIIVQAAASESGSGGANSGGHEQIAPGGV